MGRCSQNESASGDRGKSAGKPDGASRGVGDECKPMTTKARKLRVVEFYTASPRLAHACRNAVKHDDRLFRLTRVRELVQVAATRDLGKRAHKFQIVVLSHA